MTGNYTALKPRTTLSGGFSPLDKPAKCMSSQSEDLPYLSEQTASRSGESSSPISLRGKLETYGPDQHLMSCILTSMEKAKLLLD